MRRDERARGAMVPGATPATILADSPATEWLARVSERWSLRLTVEDPCGEVWLLVGGSGTAALFEAVAAGELLPRVAGLDSAGTGLAGCQPVEQGVAGLHRLVWPVVVAGDVAACLTVGPFARAEDPLDPERIAAEAIQLGLEPTAMRREAAGLPALDARALVAVRAIGQSLAARLSALLPAAPASATAADRERLYREHCLALHDLVAALDELLVCKSRDELWRQAVALAQSRLHLDRCAIFVREGEMVRGTWGTNRHGQLTDERGLAHPLNGYWQSVMEPWGVGPLWRVEETEHSELVGGQTRVFGKGWVAVTQLRVGDGVIGVMCNDDAVTGQRFDPDRQNAVALYCTLVAGLAERMAAEERLRDRTARSLEASKLHGLGQLAGGVAHEFNNLLSVVLGHLDLVLMDARLPESARNHLDAVCQAAEHASDLVRQMLTFSRGRASDSAVADLNQVLMDARSMLVILIGKHREVVYHLTPGLPEVAMSPMQLQEILLNLALNAAAALGDDGRVTVRTALDGSGRRVVWQVADNGCGMAEEVRQRVFEPFYTTREAGQGTGLGLSAVYGLVSHSHGTISCDSQPGAGTTFTIRLPAATGDGVDAAHNTPGDTAS